MAGIFMNLMLKQEQAYITIETKGNKQTTNKMFLDITS